MHISQKRIFDPVKPIAEAGSFFFRFALRHETNITEFLHHEALHFPVPFLCCRNKGTNTFDAFLRCESPES